MNILAIVYNSPAHLDFGGNGYQNGLLGFVARGDSVDLILSEKASDKSTIDTSALPFSLVNDSEPLYLAGNMDFSEKIAASIKWLADYLENKRYDYIFVDRICGYAQVALKACGMNDYIVVGTGRVHWGFRYYLSYNKKVLVPRRQKNKQISKACSHFNVPASDINYSYWSISGRQGLHFLPDVWYENATLSLSRGPVGDTPEEIPGVINLLVTYGNSMPMHSVRLIVQELKRVVQRLPEINIRVLTGTDRLRDYTVKELGESRITILKWGNYDEEFSHANFVIGHGGTSHIYNCIKYQTIPICFPSLADQFYNSARVIELDCGYSFFLYSRLRSLFRGMNSAKKFRHYCVADLLTEKRSAKKKLQVLAGLGQLMAGKDVDLVPGLPG
ncbi:MAG: hypothetical protein AAF640_08495 [Pseudomonadota bacterium]